MEPAISLEGRSEVPKTSEKQRHPEGLFLIDIVFPLQPEEHRLNC